MPRTPQARAAQKTSPTGRRRNPDRRREILAAALEIFSSKGFERSSMAEIGARVGVVEGTIYKHFASKRELLFEATRTAYIPVIAEAREQLGGIRGTRNRLRFVIWHHLKAFAVEPGICRLIIQEIRPREDYQGSVVQELNREFTALVLAIIEDALAQGEIRSDLSPAMVRDVIYGGIEHLAWKALIGRGALDVERTADDLTDLILNGLAPRGREERENESELQRLRAQVDRLERLIGILEGGRDGGEQTHAS
jgi:AcrR family transcriptional regulator